MNAADQRRLSAVLSGAAIVAAAIWLLLGNVSPAPRWDPPQPPAPLPATTTAPTRIATEAADPVIWQRPLFWADRQAPADVGDSALGGSGEFELTGVIMDGALRVALLRDRASGKSVVLRPGVQAGRWRLLSLTPRRAVLAGSGGEQLDLSLRSASPAANPAPANAAPGAATAGHAATENWPNHVPALAPATSGPGGEPIGPGHPSAIRPQITPAGAGSINPAMAERLRALRQQLEERRRELPQNGGDPPRSTDTGAGL